MMWWVTLGVIVVIALCWLYYAYYSKKFNELSSEFEKRDKITGRIHDTSWILILLIFILGVGVFIYGCVKFNKLNYTSYEKYNEKEISAIEDNLTIQGKMYFRSGYINEDLYYYYMEVLSDGSKKMGKIKAEQTIIIENSDESKIEFYKSTKIVKDKLFGGLLTMSDTIYQYKLYVPSDTVINEFNIDLK